MKKCLSLVLSAFLCMTGFISCTKPEPTPLVRSEKASFFFKNTSLHMVALGADGKLYAGGLCHEDPHPLTAKQYEELPEDIQAVSNDQNRITHTARWNYISDDVVDCIAPAPVFFLLKNGDLYELPADETPEMEEPILISQNVARLANDAPFAFILENGDLIVENKWGQFDGFEGAEDYTEAANRKYVKIAENARAASGYTGADIFAYIDAYGQLWVSGYNTYGALANGKYDPVLSKDYLAKRAAGTPIEPEGYSKSRFYNVLDDVKQVFVEAGNIFAIRNDNSLWGWGANEVGQVGAGTHGDGDPSTRDVITKPKKILENVVKFAPAISAPDDVAMCHAFMALTEEGELYAWGNNRFGCLANGKYTLELSTALHLIEQGLFADKPTLVMENVKDFSKSTSMSNQVYMVLQNNGDLYAWGKSKYGNVGNGVRVKYYMDRDEDENIFVSTPVKILEDVVYIAHQNTFGAITADGTVWNWGYNPFGWEFESDYYQDPRRIDNHVLFATPTKNPYISATIGADGTVSFVPTPVE